MLFSLKFPEFSARKQLFLMWKAFRKHAESAVVCVSLPAHSLAAVAALDIEAGGTREMSVVRVGQEATMKNIFQSSVWVNF